MAEQSELFLIEDLTTKAMKEDRIPEEKITGVKKLTGDASTRRYFRVYTTDNTYVACLATPGEENFAHMQMILHQANVRVPEVYQASVSRGFLLEEDLSDETFLKMLSITDSSAEQERHYKKAIDQLISIHKLDLNLEGAPYGDLHFDESKLMQEVRMTLDYFLGHYLKCEDSLAIKEIEKLFREIVLRISALPKVVCHRDYHSRNLMVKKDELIVIDFQDARQGPRQYDLASLVDDCYFKLEASSKDELKKYYYDQSGSNESYEEFLLNYDLVAIQRLFKAIGSFSFIHESRGDVRYLKYIGYAFENMRIKLMGLPEYRKRALVLTDIYYAS